MSTRRIVGVTIAAVTAILNWYAFYWIAVKFGSHAPAFMATSTLIAIVAHELCHLAVMERYGVMTHLVFLVILGGAVPDLNCNQQLDSLKWGQLANISMAGVAGNLVVGLAAIVLYQLGGLTAAEMGSVVNLNGILIFSNLIPFGIFDGGRFAKVFFNSVPEAEDHAYVLWIGMILVPLAFILLFIYKQDVVTMLGLLLWGLSFRAKNDDPRGSRSPLAMTRMQQVYWAAAYTATVCCGMLMVATTKSWPM